MATFMETEKLRSICRNEYVNVPYPERDLIVRPLNGVRKHQCVLEAEVVSKIHKLVAIEKAGILASANMLPDPI